MRNAILITEATPKGFNISLMDNLDMMQRDGCTIVDIKFQASSGYCALIIYDFDEKKAHEIWKKGMEKIV